MSCVPEPDAKYIERMEDLLELYARPLCPDEPVVCFDARPVQLLEWVRPASAACPGREARRGYAYFRCGTANLFCAVQPKAGWHFDQTCRGQRIRSAKALQGPRSVSSVRDEGGSACSRQTRRVGAPTWRRWTRW